MKTICERLREVSGAKRWFVPDALSVEAADTIDALVEAIEAARRRIAGDNFLDFQVLDQIDAALDLAFGEK